MLINKVAYCLWFRYSVAMSEVVDPLRNLTNSGNPLLAALGGLAAAANSIVRGGLRGENNFTEALELIIVSLFKPGRPGTHKYA